jgi:hypothetical protein
MRVLVCGGRDFRDREFLFAKLDELHAQTPFSLVIHGAAPGADYLADAWAEYRGVKCVCYPADWAKHGRAAGPIRNSEMLRDGKPDMACAFAGGRGTRDMVEKARLAGVRVVNAGQPLEQNNEAP